MEKPNPPPPHAASCNPGILPIIHVSMSALVYEFCFVSRLVSTVFSWWDALTELSRVWMDGWRDESKLQLIGWSREGSSNTPGGKGLKSSLPKQTTAFYVSPLCLGFGSGIKLCSTAPRSWMGSVFNLIISPRMSRVTPVPAVPNVFTVWVTKVCAPPLCAHSHFLRWREVNYCLQETSVLSLLPPLSLCPVCISVFPSHEGEKLVAPMFWMFIS